MSKEIKDPQAAAEEFARKEHWDSKTGAKCERPRPEDAFLAGVEWQKSQTEAQLKAVQEENDELKKELHFRKAQIAVGEDTEASLQARNKALAEENEGLEKLLLRNFNDNCTKEDMEAFMKIYARYHPEALAQEKEPRS